MISMQDGSEHLKAMLQEKLASLPLAEAKLIVRMCGHYLNLTAIAEQHYMYAPPPRLLQMIPTHRNYFC